MNRRFTFLYFFLWKPSLSKKHEKQIEIKFSYAMKKIQKHENSTIESRVMTTKCIECYYVCETQEQSMDHKRKKKLSSELKTWYTELCLLNISREIKMWRGLFQKKTASASNVTLRAQTELYSTRTNLKDTA